jgi:mercuric ion transport protein
VTALVLREVGGVRRFAERQDNGLMVAAVGGLAAAVASVACCILPLAFFLVGITGAWIGNLTALYRYHLYFQGAGVAFLAFGFYRLWLRSRACRSRNCARPMSDRVLGSALWVATALVAAAVAFPYVAPAFLRA